MNLKWYIGTFIILLALIGLNQEQTKVANQQIVLQFNDAEMTSDNTCDGALAAITRKLQALGIANIEIAESDYAKLTIRYYSDIDALSVREFLSHDGELSLTFGNIDDLPFNFPEDELPESFRLVVSDLQQNTSEVLGLHGKLAFELRQDLKRFYNPVVVGFNDFISLERDVTGHVAYRIYTDIAIAIDKTSHVIPEVRAGPYV